MRKQSPSVGYRRRGAQPVNRVNNRPRKIEFATQECVHVCTNGLILSDHKVDATQ